MGSSPLTRGKHPTRRRLPLGKGLIPAHAGKTLGQHHTYRLERAHPRSRGENCTPGTSVPITQGHPRSRGENRIAVPRASNRSGSSPLTRGKLYLGAQAFAARGLIPAHAGKTSLTSPTSLQAWAHPRSRGENFPASWSMLVPPGSSPLTRGKLRARGARALRGGLIPAHAGKTRSRSTGRRPRGAHPRSRGENPVKVWGLTCPGGSSPLTRGKHVPSVYGGRRPGLIPAHAEKTID